MAIALGAVVDVDNGRGQAIRDYARDCDGSHVEAANRKFSSQAPQFLRCPYWESTLTRDCC